MSSCNFDEPLLTDTRDRFNPIFLALKKEIPRYEMSIECEDDTSSNNLAYMHDISILDLTFEPNTAMIGLSEPVMAIAEATKSGITEMGLIEPFYAMSGAVELGVAGMEFIESAYAMLRDLEPGITIIRSIEPVTSMLDLIKPIYKPIRSVEPVISTQLKSEKEILERIEEPEDFYILSNNNNDLFLSSEEEIDALLNELKNVKYDEELARFFSNYKNDIKDLTD